MKLIIVTGCLGLIGSHITRVCLEKNWKVLGIDKCTYAANVKYIQEFESDPNFTFLKEDIQYLKYLPDCDYVINTAAESHVGNSIIESQSFIDSNITGVKNLLDLIRKKPKNVAKQPILFHFSTDEVYGDIVDGAHYESDILNPSNPYAASKAAADMLILAWSRTYNIDYLIIRPTNNYGIGQYPEKLIPLTIKMLKRNKKLRLHNGGLPIRNWLHSADTANAVIQIIESGVTNRVFNAAGGFEQENKETVRKIIDHYFDQEVNWREFVDLDHIRLGQDIRYALNDDKLRALGWKPEKVFDQEIKLIVEYYKANFKW